LIQWEVSRPAFFSKYIIKDNKQTQFIFSGLKIGLKGLNPSTKNVKKYNYD
jgi:hypothetical protein